MGKHFFNYLTIEKIFVSRSISNNHTLIISIKNYINPLQYDIPIPESLECSSSEKDINSKPRIKSNEIKEGSNTCRGSHFGKEEKLKLPYSDKNLPYAMLIYQTDERLRAVGLAKRLALLLHGSVAVITLNRLVKCWCW